MLIRATLAILVSLYVLGQPAAAEACSCAGRGFSPGGVRSAAAVFVGEVEEVVGDFPQRGTATFLVTTTYKGRVPSRVVVTWDCGMKFSRGGTYLVYAQEFGGQLHAGFCTRTRPLSSAGEDIRYLDNLIAGTPQALVHGDVFRAITKEDGSTARQALFERLEVVASSARGRRSVVTDPWGPYQIVLTPGDYELWIERRGQRVTLREKLTLNGGEERRLQFTAEYK